jgi:flagellin
VFNERKRIMASVINTNLLSLNAQRNTATSQASLAVSMQRLSSGLRVNSAKDDAAGLAISERLNAQVRGSNVAIRNANDGISLSQTAEGALSKVGDSLQRMRELAVQARNATNTNADKDSLDKEFGELAKEIQRVLGGTTFNGRAILATSAAGTQTFQVGANTTTNDRIDVTTTDMTTNGSITAVAGTDNQGTARAVIDNTATGTTIDGVINNIDTALDTVNGQRATLGAAQNRFDAVISNLQISVENQSAAKSRITDADFAAETANLSRASILQQAGNAMIAQANQIPSQVLSLLR